MSIFSNLLKKREEIGNKRNELNTEIKELDNQIEKEFEVIENKIRNILKENYYYYNPEHENYEEEYDRETYDNLRIEHYYKSISIRMGGINPEVIKQLEEEIGMKLTSIDPDCKYQDCINVDFKIGDD